MMTTTKYRTFDELMDSVRLDLKTYDLEGSIEHETLIKVAARVSYELGLKVNPSRSKTIEVVNGLAKLPSDFYVLNFALLCDDRRQLTYPQAFPTYKTYCQGVVDGTEFIEDLIRTSMKILYTETLTIVPGNNLITHDLCGEDFIIQAVNVDTGSFIEFDIITIDKDSIYIVSEASVDLENIKVTLLGGDTYDQVYKMFMDLNPCNDGTVLNPCSNSNTCTTSSSSDPCAITTEVTQFDGNTCVSCTDSVTSAKWIYNTMIPIHIDKAKTLSKDSFNMMSSSRYAAILKNGFLQTNFDDGTLYINYQSLMEDDEGTLLVMSHELVDEYYEYALKQRILENLVLNGDPKASAGLQLIEVRLRAARNNAVSFVNTPDFSELKKIWEMNRKAQYYNYYDMFKAESVNHGLF